MSTVEAEVVVAVPRPTADALTAGYERLAVERLRKERGVTLEHATAFTTSNRQGGLVEVKVLLRATGTELDEVLGAAIDAILMFRGSHRTSDYIWVSEHREITGV